MDIFQTDYIVRRLYYSSNNYRVNNLFLKGKLGKGYKLIIYIQLLLIFSTMLLNIMNLFLIKKEALYSILTVVVIVIFIINNYVRKNFIEKNYKFFCRFYIFPKCKKLSIKDQNYIRFKYYLDIRNINYDDINKLHEWLKYSSKKIDLSVIKIPVRIFSVIIIPAIIIMINQILINDLKQLAPISFVLLLITIIAVTIYLFMNKNHFRNSIFISYLKRVILENKRIKNIKEIFMEEKIVLKDGEYIENNGRKYKGSQQQTEINYYNIYDSEGNLSGSIIHTDHTALNGFKQTQTVVQKDNSGNIIVDESW